MYDLERVPRPKLAELGPTWSLGSPWVEEVELGFQGVQESTGRFLKRAAQREREQAQETSRGSLLCPQLNSDQHTSEKKLPKPGEQKTPKGKIHRTHTGTGIDYIPPVKVRKCCNSWDIRLNIQKGYCLNNGL